MAVSPDCAEYLYAGNETREDICRVEQRSLDTTLFQQKHTNDWPMGKRPQVAGEGIKGHVI
jgi:hypothetical protein